MTTKKKNPLETATITRAAFDEARDIVMKELMEAGDDERAKKDPMFGQMMAMTGGLALSKLETQIFKTTNSENA